MTRPSGEEWKALFDASHRKNLRNLTLEEFLAVAAWWEYLKYGEPESGGGE